MAHLTITCPRRNSLLRIRRSRLTWSIIHQQKDKWSKNRKRSQSPYQMRNQKFNPLSAPSLEIISAMRLSRWPIFLPRQMKTIRIVLQTNLKVRSLRTALPRTTPSRPRSSKLSASLTSLNWSSRRRPKSSRKRVKHPKQTVPPKWWPRRIDRWWSASRRVSPTSFVW